MRQQDLRPFNMARLREIQKARGKNDAFQLFWDELAIVLKCKNPKINEWQRVKKDDIVIGDVWSQPIGELYYKHKVHKFSYLCVASEGLAIRMHGHDEPANYGRQIRKVKELYVFPDGIINFCGKDQKHQLFNKYDHPIYVLSIKIYSNGTR